jgi:NTE family protein
MPNRALVMSGGGSKGAFELGAVSYLVNERKLDFQVIAGVSTGSLNATVLAQAGPGELKEYVRRLAEVWFGIHSDDDIYKKSPLQRIANILALAVLAVRNSLFLPEPLEKLLHTHVSPERLRKSGRELRVGGVSLDSGEYRSVKGTDPAILRWTLASSSIPLMFPPVRIGDQSSVDGGVRNITPLKDAMAALKELPRVHDQAEDEVWVILASPLGVTPIKSDWGSALGVGKRTLSILLNEIFREDLDYALAINESVRGYEKLARELDAPSVATLRGLDLPYASPKKRAVTIWTIVPDREYSDALSFNHNAIVQAYEAGKKAAASPLDEKTLQAALDK